MTFDPHSPAFDKIWNDPLVQATVSVLEEFNQPAVIGSRDWVKGDNGIVLLHDCDCLDPLTLSASLVGKNIESDVLPALHARLPRDVYDTAVLMDDSMSVLIDVRKILAVDNTAALKIVVTGMAGLRSDDMLGAAFADPAGNAEAVIVVATAMAEMTDEMRRHKLWNVLPEKAMTHYIDCAHALGDIVLSPLLKNMLLTTIDQLQTEMDAEKSLHASVASPVAVVTTPKSKVRYRL